MLQQNPVSELSVLKYKDELGRRTYTLHEVKTQVSREGVDWKKVFQEAGYEGEPAEAILKTTLETILQFALPPRMFEQYILNQSRYADFGRHAAP